VKYSADSLGDRQSQPLLGQALTHTAATGTLVAVPVFNEAGCIDEVLRQVLCYAENVLVIDDGSNDGTSAVLRRYSNIGVISHPQNLGYGRSLIDAFNFAAKNGFDWLITIDADHQHEPACIPRFYGEIQKNKADIISGSRYLTEADSSSVLPPADRVAINRKITQILNSSLNLHLTDAFCGFKAYRVKAIAQLHLTEDGYGLPLQLWVRAVAAGLKIREIPVPMIYHDPQRNFAGRLEDPVFRLNYYLATLRRELEQNGCQI
jgi:glycosyltransferase involved in cell wall biosynthesis